MNYYHMQLDLPYCSYLVHTTDISTMLDYALPVTAREGLEHPLSMLFI